MHYFLLSAIPNAMPKTNDFAFQVRLPETLHASMKQVAEARGVSESELARRLFSKEVQQFQASREKKKKATRTA